MCIDGSAAACLDHILQTPLQAITNGRRKSLRLIRKIASQNSGNRIVGRILKKQKKTEYMFWKKVYNKSKKCIIDLVYITDPYYSWRVKAKLYKKSSWADKQIWLRRNAHNTKSLIFQSYWDHILKLSAYLKISIIFLQMS